MSKSSRRKKTLWRNIIIGYIIMIVAVVIYSFNSGLSVNVRASLCATFGVVFTLVYSVFAATIVLVKENKNEIDVDEFKEDKEFSLIYQDLLKKDLGKYDGMQFKIAFLLTILKIVRIIFFIGILSCMFWYEMEEYAYLLYSLFISVVFGLIVKNLKSISDNYVNEYTLIYKREVIPALLQNMNPNLTYKISDAELQEEFKTIYKVADFSNRYDEINTEDYIEGYYDSPVYLKMADATSLSDTEESPVTEFKGLLACFYNIDYKNNDCIEIRTTSDARKSRHIKASNNEEFNKEFIIYATSDEELARLENSDIQSKILKINNRNLCDFDIVIRNGKVFIRVWLKNIFEPDFFDATQGHKTLYEHYEVVKIVFDLFDAVREYLEKE